MTDPRRRVQAVRAGRLGCTGFISTNKLSDLL